jgi:DNA-binding FadR family transcriptional regulator
MMRLRQVSLEEILQARLIIEPEVAADAAQKATSKDIELLEEITRDQLGGFDSENPVMQFDRNPRFHRIIAEITGNQVYIIIMQILMEIHAFRMNQFKLDEKTMHTIAHQHDGIIQALKKKDKELAFAEMKKHVLAVHNMHMELDAKKE